MTGWTEFVAAFAVFLLSHALPVRPPIKASLVSRIGPRGFSTAYSALSVLVLTWLIIAAGRAPYVELWPKANWHAWVPVILMALASVILAMAIGRPNPLSFGGSRNDEFDPANPGILGWMRHPLLVVIAIWAAAHIVPNGNLAHVILFGVFVAFAVLGMRMIDRRKRRQMGPEWNRLTQTTRRVSVTPGGIARIALGLGLYGLLLWLHTPIIGAYPLP